LCQQYIYKGCNQPGSCIREGRSIKMSALLFYL
jgi:hypothetical protein